MSLLKLFGTDKKLEREGVWFDITENDDGTVCRFKLARWGESNKELMRRQALMQKKYRARSAGSLPTQPQLDEMREIFVDTVLLEWQNVVEFRNDLKGTEEDGKTMKKMEFNRPNALFLMKELPDLLNFLTSEATSLENFAAAANEDVAKN